MGYILHGHVFLVVKGDTCNLQQEKYTFNKTQNVFAIVFRKVAHTIQKRHKRTIKFDFFTIYQMFWYRPSNTFPLPL